MISRQFTEHRRAGRIPMDEPAELTSLHGRAGMAVIRNASLGGAFVETDIRLPVQGRVFVRPLWRPGLGLEASVVRNDHTGIAVRWMQPGERTLSKLMRFHAAGVPAPGADEGLLHAIAWAMRWPGAWVLAG